MNGSDILFYLLGALILGSGLLAVSSRHIFRAAIYLLFSLIGMAGMYFWLQCEFIAAVQIVVYVGGITVLIIFSIFLTQQAGEKLPVPAPGRRVFAALAAFCGLGLVLMQLSRYPFRLQEGERFQPTLDHIGQQMLDVKDSGMALPFEVVSILLLAALIGCIVIALRSKNSPS